MPNDIVAGPTQMPAVDGPVVRAPGPRKLTYSGETSRVAAIVFINGLLNFPTLGFYRFWGKTRLRRYIWGQIRFLGDPLEYSGQAKELLLGFLVAMGILLPLFLLPGLLAFFEMVLWAQGVIELLQAAILYYLINVAIFRARRYRLSRTQWRGIRAGQSGAGWTYALKALAWGFLMLLTLGLGYALYRTRLQRYLTENTWFGDRQFEFDGRAGQLFWLWFIAWLLMIPTFGLSYVWYRVREFRYFASVTRLGSLRFRSDLEAATAILLVIAYGLVLSMVFGLIAYGVAQAFAAGYLDFLGDLQLGQSDDNPLAAISVSVITMALFFIVFYGMLRMIVLVHPLLGAICRTLEIQGEEQVEEIHQSELSRPGRGEGLADGLDIGAF